MIVSAKQKEDKQKTEDIESEFSKAKQEFDDLVDENVSDFLDLRPKNLNDYIGQDKIKRQLKLILDSAKIREVLPEHILFYGQPGLGKTTLASLISNELKANFKVVSAPSLQKIGDVVSLLVNIEANTVLFIDEIHRLKAPLEEALYTAMEDRKVDLIMGKGQGASTASIDLEPFVLVGATTQLGKISKPLKDRFPTIFQLEAYNNQEIFELVEKNSLSLSIKLDEQAKWLVCFRSRGVPRIANNILKRFVDLQVVNNIKSVNEEQAENFLHELGIHEKGLTKSDFAYLEALLDCNLALKTLAGILNEEVETLEQVTEPYLIHLGFIQKTSSGRGLTPKGRDFISKYKKNGQLSFFS